VSIFVSCFGAPSQTVDPAPRKLNMICGVHGSPGYSVTEPTLSKRTPAGTALACAAGFFVWAQPAIPARAAPARIQINKSFFISTELKLSRTASGNPLFTLLRVNAIAQITDAKSKHQNSKWHQSVSPNTFGKFSVAMLRAEET
jgi:hypothetical protein